MNKKKAKIYESKYINNANAQSIAWVEWSLLIADLCYRPLYLAHSVIWILYIYIQTIL